MHKHYILPARVFHTGAFALLISVLLNSVGLFLYSSSNGKMPTRAILNMLLTSMSLYIAILTSNLKESDGEPTSLPVGYQYPVALEVVDSDRYGMQDNNDWSSVIPVGHGFVRLGRDHAFYAVSMYHQMHCLNSFRKMFNGRNSSRATHDADHALHCLTYLRQMVLCNADATLEPAFEVHNVDGRKTQAAYGTGVTHQCRDWVQVRNFVEKNYEETRDVETDQYVATEISAIDD